MKKIVLLLTVMISVLAFGNNIEIPDNVSSAFTKKFPGAENVNWEIEFNNFKVEFTRNNKTMTALFSDEGKWVETATYINEDDLPENTLEEINWYYKNGLIISSRKAKDYKSNDFYRVTVESGDAFYFLKVDEEGDIIDTSVRYLSQKTDNK